MTVNYFISLITLLAFTLQMSSCSQKDDVDESNITLILYRKSDMPNDPCAKCVDEDYPYFVKVINNFNSHIVIPSDTILKACPKYLFYESIQFSYSDSLCRYLDMSLGVADNLYFFYDTLSPKQSKIYALEHFFPRDLPNRAVLVYQFETIHGDRIEANLILAINDSRGIIQLDSLCRKQKLTEIELDSLFGGIDEYEFMYKKFQ